MLVVLEHQVPEPALESGDRKLGVRPAAAAAQPLHRTDVAEEAYEEEELQAEERRAVEKGWQIIAHGRVEACVQTELDDARHREREDDDQAVLEAVH